MRDDWTETTLGDIASFEYGKPLKAENRDGVGFPVFGSAGEVGRHSEPLIRDAPVIVVGRKGTAGAVWWSDLPCSVIDTAYFVVPKISLDFRYLFQLLGFLDLPSLTAQTGVPGLNRERAYSSEVALPPIAEQRRIVDVVLSVDAYIDALQQQVDAARTARNAVLHELLTAGGDDWTETTLGEVGEAGLFTDGDWVESKDQDPAGDYRLLQLADIGDGVFLNKSSRYMNDVQFKRLRCTPLRHRDILIARMPDPIARACLFPPDMPVSATVVDVAILRCEDPYSAEFLVLAINDVRFREAAQALLTGTTRQRISRSNLSKIIVNLPPISEQKRIVEIVSSMDDVIQAAESAVVEAKNLRSGLLSDLLSGEHEIPVSYDELLGAA